jgi:hypothetical protein
MNEIRKKEHTNTLYDLLSSKEATSCIKKTIAMIGDTPVASFDVNEFMPK